MSTAASPAASHSRQPSEPQRAGDHATLQVSKAGAPTATRVTAPANRFDAALAKHGLRLQRSRPEILQINVGKLCNLTCVHCHVNAGPKRKEVMTRATIDRIVDWLTRTDLPTVDVTGGAPEMIPDFRHLITRLRSLTPRRRILDRCNLSILLDPGFDGTAQFLATHEVEIVASLPCYRPENVNEQRGLGVFDASIVALQLLNHLGYGRRPQLPLHLVYNPNGDYLPDRKSTRLNSSHIQKSRMPSSA